jgi:hypothetical protein
MGQEQYRGYKCGKLSIIILNRQASSTHGDLGYVTQPTHTNNAQPIVGTRRMLGVTSPPVGKKIARRCCVFHLAQKIQAADIVCQLKLGPWIDLWSNRPLSAANVSFFIICNNTRHNSDNASKIMNVQ